MYELENYYYFLICDLVKIRFLGAYQTKKAHYSQLFFVLFYVQFVNFD